MTASATDTFDNEKPTNDDIRAILRTPHYRDAEQAARTFWEQRNDPELADISVRLLSAAAAADSEGFFAYGPGLWADVCCRHIAACNFWLDNSDARIEASAELDRHWVDHDNRFLYLYRAVQEAFQVTPWNPKWLQNKRPAQRKLKAALTDHLFEMLIAGNSDLKPAPEDVPMLRTYAFEQYCLQMGYESEFRRLLNAAERDETPGAPDDRLSTQAVFALESVLYTYHHFFVSDPQKNVFDQLLQLPFIRRGAYQATLAEQLNQLPLVALVVMARRHRLLPLVQPCDFPGLPLSPADADARLRAILDGHTRSTLVKALARTLPQHFIQDLPHLDEKHVQALYEIHDTQGVLKPPTELFGVLPLIMDGYLHAYPYQRGLRFFEMADMTSTLIAGDTETHIHSDNVNRRLWVLMRTAVHLYGCCPLETLLKPLETFCGDLVRDTGVDPIDLIRSRAQLWGRYDNTLRCTGDHLHLGDLTPQLAAQLVHQASAETRDYRTIDVDIIERCADNLIDADDRLFAIFWERLIDATRDPQEQIDPNDLDENLFHLSLRQTARQMIIGIQLGESPEAVVRRLDVPTGRDPMQLVEALIDYMRNQPLWRLRGHTAQSITTDWSLRA